jgi:lipoate-protein ligase A
METWDFWQDGLAAPAVNMATDEALLLTARRRGRPLLRFYGWDRPAVSIGYVQSLSSAPTGYAVVRRPTGGGIVYHDFDFTYTVAFPSGHWLTGLDRIRSYAVLNESVQRGLSLLDLQPQLSSLEISPEVDRATMVCFTHPTRYDILLDGRKIAGSAQRRTQDGLLHQGSIHFGGPLPIARDKLAEALLQGFKEVMDLELIDFKPEDDLLKLIATLATSKYSLADWNAKRP